MTERTIHTGTQSVDVTTTGSIDESVLEKRDQGRVAVRSVVDEALTGEPEIALEASVDGDTWTQIGSATGGAVSIPAEVPDPYVRARVITAADAGSITLWISAI